MRTTALDEDVPASGAWLEVGVGRGAMNQAAKGADDMCPKCPLTDSLRHGPDTIRTNAAKRDPKMGVPQGESSRALAGRGPSARREKDFRPSLERENLTLFSPFSRLKRQRKAREPQKPGIPKPTGAGSGEVLICAVSMAAVSSVPPQAISHACTSYR